MYKYKLAKIPKSEQACFKRHVKHHYVDLGMTQRQSVRVAYEEQRAGKLKGVCRLKKLS